jgi:hypothetical protein
MNNWRLFFVAVIHSTYHAVSVCKRLGNTFKTKVAERQLATMGTHDVLIFVFYITRMALAKTRPA